MRKGSCQWLPDGSAASDSVTDENKSGPVYDLGRAKSKLPPSGVVRSLSKSVDAIKGIDRIGGSGKLLADLSTMTKAYQAAIGSKLTKDLQTSSKAVLSLGESPLVKDALRLRDAQVMDRRLIDSLAAASARKA
jgi:hypothetical protein